MKRHLVAMLAGCLAALTVFVPSLRAAESDSDARLEKLERAVEALQQENKEIRQENKELKQQVAALRKPSSAPATPVAAAAPARVTPAHAPAGNTTKPGVVPTSSEFKGMPFDLTNNELVTSPLGKSPLGLQIGDITFTLLGFLDFTSVTRSTRNGGDIGTNFASFPFSNTAAAQLGETRFSAKNSRLGLRMDTSLSDLKVLGYVETDFLGNQPTNINVASNSDTLRMRVYFVDLRYGPWEFLAGQDWSMLTPNRKGISPIPNDIFFTQNVDVNYQVGLVWERTPQVRLLYHPSDQWTFGISAENPDQYIGPGVTLPAGFDGTQVDNGSNGTATPNLMPDLLGKVAYDGKIAGLPLHAEANGIYRQYKINSFSAANRTSNDSYASGYGGSFNMSINVLPHLQLVENFYASNGAGREISTGVAPDLIVTGPDASGTNHIRTVESYAGLTGLEWDVFPNTKIYGYYGQTYMAREYDQLANGTFVGYGFPGSANTNNRRIQEWTAGLSQVLWKSDRYGDLKLLLQYSYLDREPWSAAPSTPRDATMHMGYIDVRYDLP